MRSISPSACAVSLRPTCWPTSKPSPTRGGRYFLFLKLVTDDGVEGVGECYAASFGPGVFEPFARDVLEKHVLGADPFAVETLWRNVYGRGYSQRPDISLMGMLSGFEMAMWDIVGKAVDKPVYALLGGRVHEKLRSYTYLYPDAADAYASADQALLMMEKRLRRYKSRLKDRSARKAYVASAALAEMDALWNEAKARDL